MGRVYESQRSSESADQDFFRYNFLILHNCDPSAL